MIDWPSAFIENQAFVGNNVERTIGRVQLVRLVWLTTCFRIPTLIVTLVSATNGIAYELEISEHVSYSSVENVGNPHTLNVLSYFIGIASGRK